MGSKFTCCICGKEFEGFGNNPEPVDTAPDARCCNKCNSKFVIPARVKEALRNSDDGTITKADVLAEANRLMQAYMEFVNSDDAKESWARDAVVYPMVFGTNLLANMLLYGVDYGKVVNAIQRFYNGEEFRDKDSGRPMRGVTHDDSEE